MDICLKILHKGSCMFDDFVQSSSDIKYPKTQTYELLSLTRKDFNNLSRLKCALKYYIFLGKNITVQ